MPMFRMFVASPSAVTPVNTVYREIQAFGPYIREGVFGFSVSVVLEIAEAAPTQYRNVRAFCRGWLRVVGVQSGFLTDNPTSPLILSLKPFTTEMSELRQICHAAEIETPAVISYIGVDPVSLESNITALLDTAPDPGGILPLPGSGGRWRQFRNGEMDALIPGGFILGEVSRLNLEAGYRRFEFAVRTSPVNVLDPSTEPANFLDPVVLYHELTGSNVSDGTPAIDPAEVANSWLDVATSDRVLITFRDEWNAPLVAPAEAAVVSGGAAPVSEWLSIDRHGTVVTPDGWNDYTCQIAGRKLTLVPSNRGASDTLMITTFAPSHRVVSTVRPEDWFHATDPALSDPDKNLSLYTEGNVVEPLIDGFEAFPRLVEDLRGVNATGHFVLLANWWIEHNFELIPHDTNSTLDTLLTNANTSDGVKIRALIFDDALQINNEAKNFIDSLSQGEAILDDRGHNHLLNPHGSNHWKCSVIRNSQGAFAHLGGIDINPNRLDGPEHRLSDTRYHDTHCRVQGPAVGDITKAFVDRWNDHPNKPSHLSVIATTTSPPGATCMVQVARTYGAGSQSYAPNGDRTIWAILRQAIGRAKKYIYIEDQYLVYAPLRDELLTALGHIDYLVIVIDGDCDKGVMPTPSLGCAEARYLFLEPLIAAYPTKLHVFKLHNHGSVYKVHTKVVIVDDLFATIGSANMDRRSMTHDADINVFVLDGRVEDGARKFARDLRIRLWTEHLGWHRQPDTARVRLADVDRAVEYLTTRRPHTARLDPSVDLLATASYPIGWDNFVDPDGSTPP